jgi:hypothetical protein
MGKCIVNITLMDSMDRPVSAGKRFTGRMIILYASLLFCGQASAYNGWTSELSHVAGATLVSGGITYWADKYSAYKEQRAWIGFGVSSLFFTAAELYDGNTYDNRLDIASDIVGSAIGAFVTDKWILKPVVKRESAGSAYIGLETRFTF